MDEVNIIEDEITALKDKIQKMKDSDKRRGYKLHLIAHWTKEIASLSNVKGSSLIDSVNEPKVFTFTATLDDLFERYNQIVNKVEPICQNCYHWNPSLYGNGNTGSCNLSRQRHHMMSSGCGLKTHKTFGCNQFLNK